MVKKNSFNYIDFMYFYVIINIYLLLGGELMKKSYLYFLMVSFMLASIIFISCQDKETQIKSDNNVNPVVTTEAINPRLAVSDDLPEEKFDGYNFRVLTYQTKNYEIQEESGDIIEDAVFARNRGVEDRFDINIKSVQVPGITELTTAARNSILANEDAYDVMIPHSITSVPTFITEHLILDWKDMPYVDFEKPWWNESIISSTNIFGKQPIASGSYNLALAPAFCMLFNKEYIDNYNLENLYTVVEEYRWTIDYMSNITREMSTDLNGDGVYDGNDQFGFTMNNDNTTLNFMYGFNHHSVIIGNDGYPVININNELVQSMVEKIYSLVYEDNRTFLTTYATQTSEAVPMFKEGRAFIMATGTDGGITFRDADFDFGIIPYPMWNEAQKGYYTHIDAWQGVQTIPVTISDSIKVSIILEALAAQSYKYLVPAFYDNALGIKYARDDQTIGMLDIIYNGVLYDFGYIFDAWKGATWTFPNMITSKSTDLSSYYASRESGILTNYEKIFEAILNE